MTPPAEVAGRYRMGRRLGAGGMSTVFEATDIVLERTVAVKLLAEHLADDEAFVARFRREALAAARLQHPNIVQVFDSGRDAESGRHYIVMEYVDGPSCADLLREHKQLEIERTVEIVRDACHGLDYAHRAGVIHRDVKPGNLLVAKETGLTKLADFGIAKAAEQTRITQVGSVLGTAAYLSPEQARGDESGPASDIYSLGVCAYQFLAGRLPHEYGSLTELALKQQEEPVEPIAVHRPDVPPELDRAIRHCLERDPAARYASGLELTHALQAGLHGEATEATRRLDANRHPTAARGAAAAGGAAAAANEMDATAATRMLQRGGTQISPPRRAQQYTPAPAEREAPRGGRARRWATFLAVLAIIVAIGAVGLIALSQSDNGTTAQPVDRDDVQQQIDGLRDFLREHSP